MTGFLSHFVCRLSHTIALQEKSSYLCSGFFLVTTDMGTLKFCIFAIALMAGTSNSDAQTEKKDSVDYSLNLNDLVVKSSGQRTKMKNGAMVTRIVGSPLESAGSVEDMLARVPGIMRMGGQLQVIGKGTPIYYVNGRKVQDIEELKRLKSYDIREVEVINSPGAAYDASVNAVVRIKTRRQQGEGLSGRFDLYDAQALKSGNNNLSSSINLNYRHDGLDFFGGLTFQNDYLDGYRSLLEQTTYGTGVTHKQKGETQADENFSRMHFNVGMNWQLDDANFVGVKLERGRWVHNHYRFTMEEDILRNDVKEDYLKSVSDIRFKNPNTLQANAYYNGKIGKWGIDTNVDYYSQYDKNDDHIDEQAISGTRTVESMTKNTSHLLAARIVAERPLWTGKLQVGGELTTVCRENDYRISGVENISDRMSKVSEQNYAAFFEYGFMIPKAGLLTLGLRYEHVAFDFDDLANPQQSVERNHNDLFPSLSFGTRLGTLQMQLSYGVKTTRPTYYQLRSEIEYGSKYTLQTGNPLLKNETRHTLDLSGRWKWLSFSVNYLHIKDAIYDWTTPYDDNGVVMIGMVNFDRPIDVLSAFFVASQNVGVWTTSNTVGVQKQWLSFNLDDPREATGKREVSYDNPMIIFNSDNALRLKKDWQLELNSQFYSKAHYRNVKLLQAYWNLTAAVQKSFLKDKSLVVRLSFSDIFNTARHDALIDLGNYTLLQSDVFGSERGNYSLHRVALSVRYAFNNIKSKYKGNSAGQDVIKRL